MKIEGSTALVTGANRGLGRHFAQELLGHDATVYAGARRPDAVDLPGVRPIALDITDPDSVAAAAAAIGGLTLLVNNAGSSTGSSSSTGRSTTSGWRWRHTFSAPSPSSGPSPPQLAAGGGGAILNVLSALSWLSFPQSGAYSPPSRPMVPDHALRQELAGQHTQVAALHVGYMDTDMTRGITAPKSDPAAVAKFALDKLEAGGVEILADDVSRQVRSGLAGGVTALYPQFA